MSVSGEPITKCPVCRYDLAGLPKNHTCPECGFEYDESMKVWVPHWQPRWPWLFIGFLSLLFVSHIAIYVQIGIALNFSSMFRLLGDVLLLAWWVWVILQWRRRDAYIIVGQKGLFFKWPRWAKRCLKWDEIEFPSRAGHPRMRYRRWFRTIHLPLSGLTEHERQLIYQLIRNHQTPI